MSPTTVDALFGTPSAIHAGALVLGYRQPDEPRGLRHSTLDQLRLQRWPPSWALPRRRSTTRSTGSRRPPARLGAALGLGPRAIIDELGSRNELWLEDYRVKILDGNHLPGTEHRLSPSGSPAGALPGHALVVLDPQRMLITDVVLCEDGHAQERSMTEAILEMASRRLGIKDRISAPRVPLRDHETRRDVRDPPAASTLNWEPVGTGIQRALRDGDVFEQKVRLTNDEGRSSSLADHRGVGPAPDGTVPSTS